MYHILLKLEDGDWYKQCMSCLNRCNMLPNEAADVRLADTSSRIQGVPLWILPGPFDTSF